jgi:hypothetical protein
MLGLSSETVARQGDTLPSYIGRAATAGDISVNAGLPERFGGAVLSVVSVNARDAAGDLLVHASGVKIGADKILAAGHTIRHLRDGYGPDPEPGYCDTEPGLDLKVGFSTPGGDGDEVSVTGVALSDRRDLAVLTVNTSPSFDKIPSAPVTDLTGHALPITGSGIIMAGYPAHEDRRSVQDPGLASHNSHVYVWTGPVDPADNYAITISLPPGIAGSGTSGGPIISSDKVIGVVHSGSIGPGDTGIMSIEHTVGVGSLSRAAPEPVCL